MSNGQRELSSQAEGAITRDYGPAKNTIGKSHHCLENLTGVASEVGDGEFAIVRQGDPLAHKIIQPGSARATAREPMPTDKKIKAGDKVYHKERKKEFTVSAVISATQVTAYTSNPNEKTRLNIRNLVRL